MSDNTNDNKAALSELLSKLLDLDTADLHKARTMIDGALAIHEGDKAERRDPVTLPRDQITDKGERDAALMTLAWSLYGQLIDWKVLEVPNMYGCEDMAKVAEHIRNV